MSFVAWLISRKYIVLVLIHKLIKVHAYQPFTYIPQQVVLSIGGSLEVRLDTLLQVCIIISFRNDIRSQRLRRLHSLKIHDCQSPIFSSVRHEPIALPHVCHGRGPQTDRCSQYLLYVPQLFPVLQTMLDWCKRCLQSE